MSDFLSEWQAWHDARERRLRDPQLPFAVEAGEQMPAGVPVHNG